MLTFFRAFEGVLLESLTWTGSEKFVSPLLVSLIGQLSDPSTHAIVHSMLASQNAPPDIIRVAVRALLQILVSEDASSADQPRTLLSQIRLRHPDLLQAVVQEVMAEGDSREKIEQIILSLSLVTYFSIPRCCRTDFNLLKTIHGTLASTRTHSTMIISTADSDPGVRSVAVRKLLESLSSADLDLTEQVSLSTSVSR
jgi:hypothetical protein